MSTLIIRPTDTYTSGGVVVTGAGGDLDAAMRDASDATYATLAAPNTTSAAFQVDIVGQVTSLPPGAQIASLELWVRCRTTSTSALGGSVAVAFGNSTNRFGSRLTLPINSTAIVSRKMATILSRDDGQALDLSDLARLSVYVSNVAPSTSSLQVAVYDIWVAVNLALRPTVDFTTPSPGQVFIDLPAPTLVALFTSEGGAVDRYRVKIFSGSAVVVDPENETARLVQDSGDRFTNTINNQSIYHPLYSLPDGLYRAAIKASAVGTNNLFSEWDQESFEIDLIPPPSIGSFSVEAGPGDIGVKLTVTLGTGPPETSALSIETLQPIGHSLLDARASLSATPSGWVANSNCTVTDWQGPPSEGERLLRTRAVIAGSMTIRSPRQPLPLVGEPVILRCRSMPQATARYFAVECVFYDETGQQVDTVQVATGGSLAFSSVPGANETRPGTLLPGYVPATNSSGVTGTTLEISGTFVGDVANHTPTSTAVAFELRCTWLSCAPGEVHYLSSPSLHQGEWQPIIGGDLLLIPNRLEPLVSDFEYEAGLFPSGALYAATGAWTAETNETFLPVYLGPAEAPFLSAVGAFRGSSALGVAGGNGVTRQIRTGRRYPINRGAGFGYLFDALSAPVGGTLSGFRILVRWFAAAVGGAPLATSTSPTVTESASRNWTPAQLLAQPPAGAYYAEISLEWDGAPIGELHYTDAVGFRRSSITIHDRFALRGSPQVYRITPLRAFGGVPTYISGAPSEITVTLPWDCAVHLVDESDPTRDTRIDLAGPMSITTEVGIDAVPISGMDDPAIVDTGATPRSFDALTLIFGNDNDFGRVEQIIRDGRRVLLRTPSGDGQTEQFWVRLGKRARATGYNSEHGRHQTRILELSDVLVVEPPATADVIVPEL